MPLKIEVISSKTDVREGKAKATGNDYRIESQSVWVHLPDEPFPTKSKVVLQKGQVPYQPGLYTLHDSSFSIGQFDRIEVNPVLIPIPQQNQKVS